MRNEVIAAASDVSYGAWTHSGSPYQIRYALSVFRQIEFYVGEGFRRIPYGGIEHGGILFGKHAGDAVQIEAFRPIECEHASGPSFSLSEKDLAGIRQQLATCAEQPELAGLIPVGIFISHSRRDLRVTSDEENVLSQLFHEPWQCLLIVKPEKFKPSQFAFVFRGFSGAEGVSLEDGAFVLPLAPRTERKSHGREPQNASPETPPEKAQTAAVEPPPELKPPRARVRRAAAKLKPVDQEQPAVSVPVPVSEAQSSAITETQRPGRTRLRAIVVLLSLLAVAACVLWFYWNYLEPPIELHAAAERGSVVVSWSEQATAPAKRAHLRVWANQRDRVIVLSAAERSTGRATIPVTANDVTIELVASYWLHERRGIVRVITNP